jgi:leucyl aminopeptidase
MFITDYTSASLTQTGAQLAQQYAGLKVSYDQCGYGCSDHASWNKYNYHAIMPAEKEVWTSVKRIHTEKDAPDSLVRPEYVEKFVRLGLAFGVSLGF